MSSTRRRWQQLNSEVNTNQLELTLNTVIYLVNFCYFRFHIELVQLLALCTMNKNVYTEIKCHSLLTLGDIVAMVSHKDCIPEVKEVYINFLNHCYIDTEGEVKEIYTSSHMWSLFERSFCVVMARYASATHDLHWHFSFGFSCSLVFLAVIGNSIHYSHLTLLRVKALHFQKLIIFF